MMPDITTAHSPSEAATREPAGFLEALISADQRARSWREKLGVMQTLLAELCTAGPGAGGGSALVLERLVDLAVYARFLATGEIPCVEDGRHFRPVHHAQKAEQILKLLKDLANPELTYVARKIYPFLPSTAEPFRSAEPLTRIRDIAHRNDIPSELKKEIKETLQNKLHRCAGPEDLATSKKLLERVTAAGAGYSADFVRQFRIFHDELEEFFNQRSLDRQLEELSRAAPVQLKAGITELLQQKAKSAPGLETLKKLTDVRRGFRQWREGQPVSQAQAILIADIALEDFAFVLLSEAINRLERGGQESVDCEGALRALLIAIRNLELSGISPEECAAILNELQTWGKEFAAANREQCLRLKATVERAQRLAESFSDEVIALFVREAERVGRALHVADHAIRVFGEAEVRRHLVFQVSKLVSLLLANLRQALGTMGWDVLVAGQATGRLLAAESLEGLGVPFPEPVLALLNTAQGDEEMPSGVTGVVLGHPIPHLSHLGVRARQAQVVFVTSEVEHNLEPLRALKGQIITLTATLESVRWQVAPEGSGTANEIQGVGRTADARPRASLPSEREISAEPVGSNDLIINLDSATAAMVGPKAFGARRLAELAKDQNAGFRTPRGLAIPFAALRAAFEAAPQVKREYQEILGHLPDASAQDFGRAAERLAEIVRTLPVPQEIQHSVASHFGDTERVMVRSSSNCEDLETSAGAGLYESVANVPLNELRDAVRVVWASLWTRRAALDRQQSGIAHREAQMAVLIQGMLMPDYSFVLHTVNPLVKSSREVYIELAVGLGESLVSAQMRGTPYRFTWDKDTGKVLVLAFANFSRALRPGQSGGVSTETVDYSKCALSREAKAREDLAARLGRVATFVETAYGKAMDIEGAIVDGEIYLVQARPQQGLHDGREEGGRISPELKQGPAAGEPEPIGQAHEFEYTNEKVTPGPLPCLPREQSQGRLPATRGLFERRIAGDDALMELARLRFQQAGLGAEVHAGTPEQLEAVLRFEPASVFKPVVHLPRDFNLGDDRTRGRIRELAARFGGRVYGFVIHDRSEWEHDTAAFVSAASEMDRQLRGLVGSPLLFVEYAVGLEPRAFVRLFRDIQDLETVSACIDVGHVGIRCIRAAYEKSRPGEDICALKSSPPELPRLMPDVEKAVSEALPAVLNLISAVSELGKPVHFHLHDGHPLSKFSPFGVSDHLSFRAEIPLSFEYLGRCAAPTMFGPAGLSQIIARAMGSPAVSQLSFTLEIHPTSQRQGLGDAEHLFRHWSDKTNAEMMNHWLWVLAQNQQLLPTAMNPALAVDPSPQTPPGTAL